jgi:hypothetical protein
MTRSKWIPISQKSPLSKGKYWVFPYRTTAGTVVVAWADYKNGKWESTTSQEYDYWQPIEVPKPPKVKYEENHRMTLPRDKLYDI